MGSAELGMAGERMAYGNQAGRNLLEDTHDMKERMKRLEDRMAYKDTQIANQIANHQAQLADYRTQIAGQIANHQAQLADYRTQIARIQHRVDSLTTDAEGYYKIRHRFIDFYRRDVRRDVTDEGRARIHNANISAHEGDAITDAKLYTTGQRFDEDALIDLYGLTANQISFLSKCLIS